MLLASSELGLILQPIVRAGTSNLAFTTGPACYAVPRPRGTQGEPSYGRNP
jgi:hypothetical protein